MILRFSASFDDIVAFNRYHFAHSPWMKRRRVFSLWVMPLIFVFVFGAMALHHHHWGLAIVGFFGALILFLSALYRYGPGTARRVRRLYREGKNKGLLGERLIELTRDGLIVRTEVGESKIKWDGIERIARTDDYSFIYLNAITAVIIPRKAIVEGDHDQFMRTLRERCAPANAGVHPKTGEG